MRFLFLIIWISAAAKTLEVDVKAVSAVLMNAETGAVLYEKNSHAARYPASTTKIATALYILAEKEFELPQMVKISSESLKQRPQNKAGEFPPYWWYSDGTNMGLKEGEWVSFNTLLNGMMLVSGNDAANALAEALSGSIPLFVEEMNRYLKKIGCLSTNFLNPHGCHHPEHLTTAYDLCLMTSEALKLEKFRELVSSLSYTKPKSNKQGAAELKQINQLLKPGRFFYQKAIGVKSGFHLDAQYTLVAAAEDEERTLVASILGSANGSDRYADAIKLFEAAFNEVKETRSLFGPEHVFARQIPGAKSDLTAALDRELSISYFPSEEPLPRAFVRWFSAPLPIKKGQKVAELDVVDAQGAVLAREPLFAKAEVKATLFFALKDALSRLFEGSIRPDP